MSVAFRRDSDEEHLEPKFEIPMLPGPNLVTPRGLALINTRVAELEAQIKGGGDDLEITAAKRELRYWQTRQITAEIAPPPSGEAVEIGTTVTFRLNGKQRNLSIVGADEADPASDLIAFSAPLSRALMGAMPGDMLPFGNRDDAIELLSIAITATDASAR